MRLSSSCRWCISCLMIWESAKRILILPVLVVVIILQGAAFAFVEGLSAIQTNPPIKESHVEMDAAWAMYESMLKIQMGDAETALIYGFGKSSPGDLGCNYFLANGSLLYFSSLA